MTFGIVTINYLRPLVLRLWLASMDRLRSQFGNFPVVCVSGQEDKTICEEHNVSHIAMPNKPLSDKWNVGFQHMKERGVDYIVILGSDDIASDDYMRNAISAMERGFREGHVKSLYFYSAMKDYPGQLFYYNHVRSLGVGRFIHRSVLDKIEWTPYRSPRNWGLDSGMWKAICLYVNKSIEVTGAITDVKTRTNMNSIRVWARKIQQPTPSEVFYNYLSKQELDLLERIKKS